MKKLIAIFPIVLLLLSFIPNSLAETNDEKLVTLQTNSGKITIELFSADAPNHVKNFIDLTESGFYDRTVFHRVIEGFMIQGGDPKTQPGGYESVTEWGTGNPGYTIDAEFNDIKHNRGIVSMARANDPNSAGSQFFIVHQNSNFLDCQYTVFGRIVTQESFETLDKIAALETAQGGDIPITWGSGEILKAETVDRSDVSDILDLGEPERKIQSCAVISDETYSNDRLGISLFVPAGWSVQEPPKTHPEVPDIAFIGSPSGDNPPPYISLTIEFTNGRTLDDLIEHQYQQLQPHIDSGNLQVISEDRMTINDRDTFVRQTGGVYVNPEDSSSLLPIKSKQANFMSNDKFYILTYTSVTNFFDDNVDKFDKALNSFELDGEVIQKDTQNDNNNDDANGDDDTTNTNNNNDDANGDDDSTNTNNNNDDDNGGDDSTNTNNGDDNNDDNNTQTDGGCLIATAAFGSELSGPVQQLREIRDNMVMQTESGSVFMSGFNQVYYLFSPTIADLERENPIFKELVKGAITPLLATLSLLNYVDVDSEAEMLGYGLGIISLNIGLYFAMPAMIIHKLRNRK